MEAPRTILSLRGDANVCRFSNQIVPAGASRNRGRLATIAARPVSKMLIVLLVILSMFAFGSNGDGDERRSCNLLGSDEADLTCCDELAGGEKPFWPFVSFVGTPAARAFQCERIALGEWENGKHMHRTLLSLVGSNNAHVPSSGHGHTTKAASSLGRRSSFNLFAMLPFSFSSPRSFVTSEEPANGPSSSPSSLTSVSPSLLQAPQSREPSRRYPHLHHVMSARPFIFGGNWFEWWAPAVSPARRLLAAVGANAYIVRRRRVGTSSVSSLKAIGEEETLPPYNARPFEKGLFQWSIVREEGNDYLEGNFSYNGDYYAAVGLSSPKRMQGPIIVCYVNSTVQVDSYATCLDYHGGNYQIQRAPTYTDMIDASVTPTGGVSLTFRRLLRRGNKSSEDLTNLTLDDPLDEEPMAEGQTDYDVNNPIPWGETVRVIFAKGKFYDNARRPKQHEADDVRVVMVDWVTGQVSQLESKRHVYVLGAAAGTLLVLLIGGFVIHRFPALLPAWSRLAGTGLIAFIFLAFCIGYSLANYFDYKDTVTGKAHVRSLGDGAAFAFVCMMICVSRRLVMETCFGISPERAVFYHGVCCAVFFAAATAHAVGMLYFYGLAWSLRWRDKDHISKLPGIIGYLLCVPVMVFGLLRNRGTIAWQLYKYSHALHIPIVFLLCCHYKKLVYGLIAPAVLVLLDIALERFSSTFEAEVDVVAAVEPLSQCTIIRVYTPREVKAGQWFRVQIPAISRDYHPLFVCVPLFYDNDDPYLEFVVKNTCDVTDQPWSRTCDRQQLEAAKSRGGGKGKGSSGGHLPLRVASWTSRLYHTVLANEKPIGHVRLRGPCGEPTVNAIFAENILFVAGGVGIAPVMSQLTALTCGFNAFSTDVGRQHVVSLVWVIPNVGLLNTYGHALAQCKMYLKLLNRQMAVSFKVFVTDSRGPSQAEGGDVLLPPEVLAEVAVVRGQRPDAAAECRAAQKLIDAAASWSTLEDGRIEASSDRCAAYMCGPDGLLNAFAAVLKERNEKAAAVNKARDPKQQRAMTEFIVGSETFRL